MNKWLRLVSIGILVVLLILVRAFSKNLFYDPFISYFNHDYLYKSIPGFGTFKLFFHLFLRYLLNAIISLGIIYATFQNKRLIKFSVKFYVLAFIVLAIVYYILLRSGMGNGHLFTFYVRRFLIHPVFVLILLPAFYYQKRLVQLEKDK